SYLLQESLFIWCGRGEIMNGRSAARRSPGRRLPVLEYGGCRQHTDAAELASASDDFSLGAAGRAALPFALDCRGNFLHRNLDAERGRRLADDPAHHVSIDGQPGYRCDHLAGVSGDRKSTRLNSSHPSISYAVFCLKKKQI